MAKIQDIRNRTRRTNGTRNLSQIKNIVRHHSATTSGNFDSFWRHWNGTLGWGTGGYHEIILRDGTVQLCYDPNEITNGVAGQNTVSYHICLVGNGSFTDAQEKAWDERVKYNMDRLNVGVNNVKGHGEMPGASTSCPGINMNTVRYRIRGGVKTKSAPKQQTKSAPSSKTSTYTGNSLVDYLESIDQNSSFSNRKKLANQYGISNYRGTASQNTELLNKLRGKSSSASKSNANLKVDGYWGKATTRALQHRFGTPVDGEIWGQYRNQAAQAITQGVKYGAGGSPVIKALQRHVGAKRDGVLGRETVTKLQQHLGTPADGVVSSPSTMVKEMQRRLNAGTF